jgi:hypothetical protein
MLAPYVRLGGMRVSCLGLRIRLAASRSYLPHGNKKSREHDNLQARQPSEYNVEIDRGIFKVKNAPREMTL